MSAKSLILIFTSNPWRGGKKKKKKSQTGRQKGKKKKEIYLVTFNTVRLFPWILRGKKKKKEGPRISPKDPRGGKERKKKGTQSLFLRAPTISPSKTRVQKKKKKKVPFITKG